MTHKNNCFICGKEIIYKKTKEELVCFYCGKSYQADASCTKGHYVCDKCHSTSANDLIEQYCISTQSQDPLDLALILMKHKAVKMHGPEHHFLVPAVLLAAYYNKLKNSKEKKDKIKQARKRSEQVAGGWCGFLGSCGAAVGAGIFMSLIKDATPLSKEEWKDANMMTAQCLYSIAEHGGPRCCKRNTLLAISRALECLDIKSKADVRCDFSNLNKECLGEKCLYHKGGF